MPLIVLKHLDQGRYLIVSQAGRPRPSFPQLKRDDLGGHRATELLTQHLGDLELGHRWRAYQFDCGAGSSRLRENDGSRLSNVFQINQAQARVGRVRNGVSAVVDDLIPIYQ